MLTWRFLRTGSLEGTPKPVGDDGCQFESCPPDSPPAGSDPENPRLNYVNSFPVTAMKFGVSDVAPKFFQGKPDLVVTGPNVGGT